MDVDANDGDSVNGGSNEHADERDNELYSFCENNHRDWKWVYRTEYVTDTRQYNVSLAVFFFFQHEIRK